jgi:hypothetical protein
MWSRLNVWIMSAECAARIDDRDGWSVFTVDAHQRPFTWKGVDYSAGINASAPGYVDFELPPGTYVVWAERRDGRRTIRTHKTVAAIHAEPQVVVRLLMNADTSDERDKKPTPECSITITELEGRRSSRFDYPVGCELSGTATGCAHLHVVVRRIDGEGQIERDVGVQSDGTWRMTFDNDMRLRCGEIVLVEATCADDKTCRRRTELSVRCAER